MIPLVGALVFSMGIGPAGDEDKEKSLGIKCCAVAEHSVGAAEAMGGGFGSFERSRGSAKMRRHEAVTRMKLPYAA
jgi:hypothetical protein